MEAGAHCGADGELKTVAVMANSGEESLRIWGTGEGEKWGRRERRVWGRGWGNRGCSGVKKTGDDRGGGSYIAQ